MIVSATVVVCVRLPEIPVIVTVATPTVAVLAAVNVNLLDVVALAGLNDAVSPAGKPLAARLTELLKPLIGVIVIVVLPLAPATTLTLLGEEDKE